MRLVKGAPNLMQRLSRLPPAPNVTLLYRRKPKSLSWPHANTTLPQQIYIGWCCIELSNAPRQSGTFLTGLNSVTVESVNHNVEKNSLGWRSFAHCHAV
jgi:hypothetical protein